MQRESTAQEKEVFTYLNELRESGDTNMFGARSYIMAEFPEISAAEAKRILMLWMDNFNEKCDYTTINEKQL